jgi:hypothetical protein
VLNCTYKKPLQPSAGLQLGVIAQGSAVLRRLVWAPHQHVRSALSMAPLPAPGVRTVAAASVRLARQGHGLAIVLLLVAALAVPRAVRAESKLSAPTPAGGARAALAAAAAAAPQQPGHTYPALASAGPRHADDPATGMCACVDQGLNDPICFSAVTNYCEAKVAGPNMTLCAAMSDFLNRQEPRAGTVVATFLVKTCRVTVPRGADACACLQVGAAGGGRRVKGAGQQASMLIL